MSPGVGAATNGVIEEAAYQQDNMFTAGVRTVVDETLQMPGHGGIVTGVMSPVVAGVMASPKALSQRELYEAISSGVVDGISRLGILEKHTEVLEAVTKVTVPPPDLTPIMRGLSQILSLKDSHSEVLEAITNVTVEQPDLSPIMRAISQLASLQDGHKEVMEAITNIVVEPPDMVPVQQMMQDLRADMKMMIDDFRKDMQDDMGVLQQEMLKNREETRGDAEVLLQELQNLPREIEDVRKELRRLDKKADSEHSEVLRALGDLAAAEPDTAGLASAVHDRLLRTKLKVDNADVLQALKNLELDQPALAAMITDKMRKHTFGVDNSEVLQAIRRLPETEAISRSVHDRLMKSIPDRNDHAELLDTVRRIKREPDLTPILSALSSSEVDFSPVFDAISRIKLDHGPVLEAIRRIDPPDVEAIGRVVGDKIRRANGATHEECAELLGAIRRIPDNSEVLDALRGLESSLDLGVVLDAVRDSSGPDQHVIAGAVFDKIKRAVLQTDNSEVLSGLSGIRLAIGEAGRFDMGALLQEISKVALVQSDHSDLLRAIANVQLECRQLRESLAVQQRVVQTVVPQAPQIVKQIVQPPQPVVVPQVMQQKMVCGTQPLLTGTRSLSMERGAAQESVNLSPRVVAEIYGPKVELRPTPSTQSLEPVLGQTTSFATGMAQEVVASEYLLEEREASLTPQRVISMSGGFSPDQAVMLQETTTEDVDFSSAASSRPPSRLRSGSRARFPGAAAI